MPTSYSEYSFFYLKIMPIVSTLIEAVGFLFIV
jgi:hypothetical protein